MNEPAGLAGQAMRGALLMVALRFTMRGIGLVSVVLMARILSPEDFGVIGTAALVTGAFAILQQTGIGEGLTRLQHLERSHVNTAWTIGLLSSGVVTLLVLVSIPFAAEFLKEPKLVEVLPWLALMPLIGALSSPGSVLLMRNMAFGHEFRLRTLQKILAVITTVGCSLWFGNYYGLVAGSLFGSASAVVLTYILHPYRPGFTLEHWRYFTGFSAWTLVQASANYVTACIDEVFVRRITGATAFGQYHVSRDLCRVLVAEMVAPASAALLPTLSRFQDDLPRFVRATEHAIGVAALVAGGAACVLSIASPQIIRLLLGPQWLEATPILAILSFGVAATAVAEVHRGVLAARNETHVSAGLWVLRAVVLTAACAGAAAWVGTPLAVATAFTVAALATLLLDFTVIFTRLGVPGAVLRVFVRPALAAGLTELAFQHIPKVATGLVLADGVLQPLAVALFYLACVGVLWLGAGRPDSGENALLQRLFALRRPA